MVDQLMVTDIVSSIGCHYGHAEFPFGVSIVAAYRYTVQSSLAQAAIYGHAYGKFLFGVSIVAAYRYTVQSSLAQAAIYGHAYGKFLFGVSIVAAYTTIVLINPFIPAFA